MKKRTFPGKIFPVLSVLLLIPAFALEAAPLAAGSVVPSIGHVRVEFILFALTLAGVALFHRKTMVVALTGLGAILLFKYAFDPAFSLGSHLFGDAQREGEWRILLNLLGLLFGFTILAKHFESSRIPDILPRFLPDDWKGGLVLLLIVMIMSTFLDNIAAAMIGGTIAMVVYKGKVHLGYLAAIVAASNAGGAGSVVGDTTTTLMWIDGVNPLWVFPAFLASFVAFIIFGVIGSIQQDKYWRIQKDSPAGVRIDRIKILIVIMILVGAILTNYFLEFPAAGVWIAILAGSTFSATPWSEMKHVWKGTVFLIALVTSASLMPVEELPPASWQSAFALGFISAVFDNIPLTKLCLDQGGYDWGMLAYAVGFGGSMIWFGSSAGVALSNIYPEAKNTFSYLRKGWHIVLAYTLGFFVMLSTLGWNPHPPHRKESPVKTESMEGKPRLPGPGLDNNK